MEKNNDNALSTTYDNCNSSEIPENIETFSKIIESRIAKHNSGETPTKFGKMTEEELLFLEAVMHLSKLANEICKSPSGSTLLNRTNIVLKQARTFMEEEFRTLLENFRSCSTSKVDKNSELSVDEDYPFYPHEVVTRMNRIANAMISVGFETECCQVYSISRRNAFNEQLKMLEFEKINVEDVHRMAWDSLEVEITRWINVVKNCTNTLFPGERRLGETIFSESPMISKSLFSNLARSMVIQILDFAEAVSRTKRSAEKLFKFLDIYEAIRNLVPAISESLSNECEHELKSEILATRDRFGESTVNIFCDLENSIKNDAARTPVPGGAVHPLTRYVMNYLKYACEYKDSLEHIFQEHAEFEASSTMSPSKSKSSIMDHVDKESESPHDTTPFSAQLVKIMDLLDSNLKAKSNLYRDPSLRDIFLMNNGRYILQKAKGSNEIRQVIGDTWCRRRSTTVRQYHKNYQRETWGRVLQILSHDGMQVNGKVTKPVVKERFKNFSTLLDEILRTQSTWVVSDEQLRSELRVSISAVLIPAYRSFFGRFRQYVENSKHADKYIKYQPEDIETLVEGLFDGNPTSMARRKM